MRVWKSVMDDEHLMKDEKTLDTMAHYESLFEVSRQNNREAVLKNTYALNETLHRKDIDEKLRSQFVGTTLLYLRDVLKRQGITDITDETRQKLRDSWGGLSPRMIRGGIEDTLSNLLDGSDNKLLVEIEEKAFGLATTNMLIHGDGNSNIKKASLFDSEAFFRQANPDIILMNPPYNAKPITITKEEYKKGWKKDAKEDPTKGMVFLKFISDVVAKMNKERLKNGEPTKEVKVAILLPVAAAIGTSSLVSEMKSALLEENTWRRYLRFLTRYSIPARPRPRAV